MIEINNISKFYKTYEVFSNISFSMKKGECLGIVGANGSGKSTLIDCIINSNKLSSGIVKLDINNGIGVQFQEAKFDSNLKVIEICNLLCTLNGVNKNKIDYYLNLFNMDSKRKSYARNLSGGENQKLSIICALLHEPELMIFDELTTGLDTLTRNEVYKILLNLKKDGKTIILVTHYYEELDNLADKVLVLKNARGTLFEIDESLNTASNLLKEVMLNGE